MPESRQPYAARGAVSTGLRVAMTTASVRMTPTPMTPRSYPVIAPRFHETAPLSDTAWDVDEPRLHLATGHRPDPRRAARLREAGKIKAYEQNHHDEILAFDTAGDPAGEHGGALAT